jgi:hypothetical protein
MRPNWRCSARGFSGVALPVIIAQPRPAYPGGVRPAGPATPVAGSRRTSSHSTPWVVPGGGRHLVGGRPPGKVWVSAAN